MKRFFQGGGRKGFMRAWQIQRYAEPLEALSQAEVPLPDPGPCELRLRVEAAGLGLPDVFMCRGQYAFRPELPFTPGQEVVGRVTAAGAETETDLGSRVMAVTAFFRGLGGLAEEALALDAAAYPAPAEMDAATAAGFVIPYHTAYLGLVTRGRLQPDETLLVLGAAGGTGAAAIQLAKALGARVIAVAGGAAKVEACREWGADLAIDHERASFAEVVMDETRGLGVNCIYDPVGGSAFAAALECLASEGRLLAVGYASGAWSDASTQALVRRNASVLGVFVGAYTKPLLDEVHSALLDLWRRGAIRSIVTRSVDWSDAAKALHELSLRRTSGKTVVRVVESVHGAPNA